MAENKRKKPVTSVLAALLWLSLGVAASWYVGAFEPPPAPPYKVERNDGQALLCVNAASGSKLCMDAKLTDQAAMKAAETSFAEDKEILRAFCAVFTVAPPLFVLLVLFAIARSGGIPAGLQSVGNRPLTPP